MKLWEYQRADSPRCDGGILHIHRLRILWWWRIWSSHTKSKHPWQKQRHIQGQETAYMAAHPEIWPPDKDYSAVYAEHHISEPASAAFDTVREKPKRKRRSRAKGAE